MKITFWGAAQTTTGSFHLLESEGKRVALDCGLFQGRRSEFYERNATFPVPADTVDALLLSHAHIDHCGNIPNFVTQGFAGSIFTTHATADLVRTMLLDSAFIQQKDAQFVNKKRAKHDLPPIEPLYTVEQAEKCFDQLVAIGYYRWFCFVPGFCGKFIEAGHILGSAQIELEVTESSGKAHRLAFSGDIGRGGRDILRDPETPSEIETLIMESTYGNRVTGPVDSLRESLRAVVQKVVDRGGKIIIPAFSVGRTQDVVYQLNILFNENLLPRIPIFVDSPLSTNVTEIFKNHPECFNRTTRDILLGDDDVFGFKTLTYIRDVEDSKRLNDIPGSCIIISSSGMCEAGRILHHLRNNISDPKNCILIVGYQSENTLGRQIVEKRPKVKIFGEVHDLRAEVQVFNGFSGHADQNELREYAFKVEARSGGMLRRIFLVHGETPAQEDLAAYLREHLKVEVIIPKRGETFEIT
ncbi:MBL fold metallo-hydrolase [soil metagenome]